MPDFDLLGEPINFRLQRGDDLVWSIDFGALDLTGASLTADVTDTRAPLFAITPAQFSAVGAITGGETQAAPDKWSYRVHLTDTLGRTRTLFRGYVQVIG